MILLLATVLALLVALVRGGTLGGLASVRLRYGWLAILAFAVQTSAIYFPDRGGAGPWELQALVLVGSQALLLVVVGLNGRLPGMPLVGLGLALNLLVMAANGGYMPITPEALARAGLGHLALSAEVGSRLMATKDILLPRAATRLWVLSDVFVIPAEWPASSAFSAGDVALVVGVWLFFQRTMAPRHSPLQLTRRENDHA